MEETFFLGRVGGGGEVKGGGGGGGGGGGRGKRDGTGTHWDTAIPFFFNPLQLEKKKHICKLHFRTERFGLKAEEC